MSRCPNIWKYLDIFSKLEETIVFEKNATLKTFLGVHYFSFKKDGLLSSRFFKVSISMDISTDERYGKEGYGVKFG